MIIYIYVYIGEPRTAQDGDRAQLLSEFRVPRRASARRNVGGCFGKGQMANRVTAIFICLTGGLLGYSS